MIKASLLSRVPALRAALTAAISAALLLALAAPAAFAASDSAAEKAAESKTPVDLTGASSSSHGGGGSSFVRTIVGLAIVIGVIYGIAWVLRQRKAHRLERMSGAGLASVASLPLGQKGSVHLVRAGRELVLVGVGEHGVTPIRTYTEADAFAAGLVDEHGDLVPVTIDGDEVAERSGGGLAVRDLRPRALVEQARAWTVRR